MEYITKEQLLQGELEPQVNTDIDFGVKSEYCRWIRKIANAHCADVASIRHGKWMWSNKSRKFECSLCMAHCLDQYNGIATLPESNYCQNCGAKMDLG